MTADGELVLHHDDTLLRTSNVGIVFPFRSPWNIHEFTLKELRLLDFGTWFLETDPFMTIATGEVPWNDARGYISEPILTLREALVFTRENDWRVNLELKDHGNLYQPEFLVEKVISLVQELRMRDQVLISSFNHDYLVHARAMDPSISTGALVECFTPDSASLVCRLKGQSYHPRIDVLKTDDFVALQEEGIEVLVWTVNDEATMRRLINSGVTGIITDFPQLLHTVLAQDQSRLRTS